MKEFLTSKPELKITPPISGPPRYIVIGVLVCALLIWVPLCLSGWLYVGPKRLISRVFKIFKTLIKAYPEAGSIIYG